MGERYRLAVLVTVAALVAMPAFAQQGEALEARPGDLNDGGTVPVLLAVPLPQDSAWHAFHWNPGPAPNPIIENPLVFDAGGAVFLDVTDSFVNRDRFRVYDDGVLLGETSAPVAPGAYSNAGQADYNFGSPLWSSGTFNLCHGEHRIELFDLVGDSQTGAGFIRVRPDPGSTVICQLVEDVTNLEAKADLLEVKADELQIDVDGLPVEITEIKAELDEIKNEAQEIKDQLADVKAEVMDHKAELVDVKAEVAAIVQQLVGIDDKLDQILNDMADVKAELVAIAADLARAREERILYACMTKQWIATYFLPAARNGIITEVRDLVTQRVADIAATGKDTYGAQTQINQGNNKLSSGKYDQAYQKYCVALCKASVPAAHVSDCSNWSASGK